MSANRAAAASASGWSVPLLARFSLVSTGVWLYAADTLVTATTAPGMVLDIGGVKYLNWGLSLYEVGAILAGSAVAMLCGRFGVKRILCLSAIAYAVGCAISAVAADMLIVVAGRFVQGLGGGLLMALCYVAMYEWFPQNLWNRLIAIEALIWAAGALLGPLIGGLFLHVSTWRGAFWAFAGQAIALLCASLWLPPDAPQSQVRARWPWLPLSLLFAGTLAIACAGIATAAAIATLECAAGIVLLYAAARCDRRLPDRLLPSGLLDFQHPIGSGLMLVLSLAMSTTGFWLYGPLLLKIMFGTDPLSAGYILAAESIVWSLATLAAPRTALTETQRIRIGTVLAAVGASGFTLTVPAGTLPGVIACALLQGAGFGVCWSPILRRLVRSSGDAERSLASASQSTVQKIGYAIGTAGVGIAANVAGLRDGISMAAARSAGIWVFAAAIPVLVFAVLSAWRFTTGPSTSHPMSADIADP